MIQIPQNFVIRQECAKVAFQNGFRRELGEVGGWAAFSSTTVPGTLHLAAADAEGPWFLALDHAGVIEELDLPIAEIPGPGLSRYTFETLGQLYSMLPRVYQLAVSLPDVPLREFLAKVKELPMTTEAERLVVQRIGQNIFRASLMDYWQSRCPLTDITDPALLRASHIIPWSQCETDEQRLDVHNGLLLSALWDAAFDTGFVTFDDSGCPLFSSKLGVAAKNCLTWTKPVLLTDMHRRNLDWHRQHIFK